MNIDNITSDSMVLTNDGKAMLIKVYEEEIERLNNIINELENEKDRLGSLFYERNEENIKMDLEIERLHSIIKEVREYIEKTKFKYCDDELCYMIDNHYNNILEILDKVDKEEYQL